MREGQKLHEKYFPVDVDEHSAEVRLEGGKLVHRKSEYTESQAQSLKNWLAGLL